jgi:hypothetical protein
MCRARRPHDDLGMTNDTPAAIVAAINDSPELPAGDDERFAGFGIMGLPFASGHYLGLRQFPVASFAPAYASVWHRDPAGRWTFYATTPGEQSCARYFSSATSNDAVQCGIDVSWVTPWTVRVTIDGLLDWTVELGTTAATRLMSHIGNRLPESAWTNPDVLSVISRAAGRMLGVGQIRLAGTASNGQAFMVAPRTVWAVSASSAKLRGEDLGAIGPLAIQARLGGFRLPQRGIAVVGNGHFEKFNPDRHRRSGRTVALALG